MEDNAQESDQDSTELADGETTDSVTDDDTLASEGDVLGDEGSDENEDSAGSSDEEEATDELEDGKPKVVPIARLRTVIEERNDLREQNKIFKTLLAQQDLKKDGGTAEEEKKVKADLSKYTPKQVAEAKALLEGVLQQEMGQMSELQKEVKLLREENEVNRREQFAQKDNAKLVATLKEFKGEFKYTEVEAQIQAWHASGNPELQSLAKAPYRTILREMQAIKAAKTAKKPKSAPRVPSDGSDGSDGRKFQPKQPQRSRPDPRDTTSWENNLAIKAQQMMTATDE